jgi:hypothetical protein
MKKSLAILNALLTGRLMIIGFAGVKSANAMLNLN